MALITTTEPTWEELLGKKQWEGLLDPLDINLRKLILRCGDFCQATYDAFNSDGHSKYCGSSRYGKRSFFHEVALPLAENYDVVAFLYATASSKKDLPGWFIQSRSVESWDPARETNWMGYIAVTTDEVSKATGRREIYVAWRGTIRPLELFHGFNVQLVDAEVLTVNDDNDGNSRGRLFDDKTPKIMNGWLTIYTSDNPNSSYIEHSARTQLRTKINELVNQYKEENLSITFTGHSLGGALSLLSVFDLIKNGLSTIPVTAFIFGSPKVGNKAFNDKLKTFQNLRILHIKNKIDVIPLHPLLFGYAYTGKELVIDIGKSPNLKVSMNPTDWHNLQALLHVVAGWNGEDGEFDLKVKRSVALVNKSCDFLKEEFSVPASWWVEKNKGMVLDEDGEWVMSAPPLEEDMLSLNFNF